MSRRAKRGTMLFLLAGGVCGLLVYLAHLTTSERAVGAAQAVPDVGLFRVGSQAGEERAGFSGRAMVQVMTSDQSPDWPAISACLQSAEVGAQMADYFVGVLVDEALEPAFEAALRAENSLGVIVRGLNGAFLGWLPVGFRCEDLVLLLGAIRQATTSAPEKSPIYVWLLESPAPVDDLVRKGQADLAARYIDLLAEFEGENSPAVQAAEARLPR